MSEDAELLRRYATAQSEAAFAELVQRHVDLVFSAALRLVNGDAHRAQDVTQQVFGELARQARRLVTHPALAGWLYTTTRLVAWRAIRSEQRRKLREVEANTMTELLREPAPDWEHLRPVLEDAMHQLGEKDRLAVLLRFFKNKSLQEVGLALGLSENAARMRVDRAPDKLRGQLARQGVTSTATALAAMLSGNAISAAPAGLATTLTNAVLAGVPTGNTILNLLKIMATTKLKTGLIGMVVAASVMWPVLLQHRAQARLHLQDETLRQQKVQLGKLQQENDQLAMRISPASQARAFGDSQFNELLRLRGEIGRLRAALHELESYPSPQSRGEKLASLEKMYSERVEQLKQLLENNPSQKIPELQYLKNSDWLWLANKANLQTENGSRMAMSLARQVAQENFAKDALKPALELYIKSRDGQFPGQVAQLAADFSPPIDEAILHRWEVLQNGNLVQELRTQVPDSWFITQKAPVDAELDQRIIVGRTNIMSFALGSANRWMVVH